MATGTSLYATAVTSMHVPGAKRFRGYSSLHLTLCLDTYASCPGLNGWTRWHPHCQKTKLLVLMDHCVEDLRVKASHPHVPLSRTDLPLEPTLTRLAERQMQRYRCEQ
jgi:hypothetical protein